MKSVAGRSCHQQIQTNSADLPCLAKFRPWHSHPKFWQAPHRITTSSPTAHDSSTNTLDCPSLQSWPPNWQSRASAPTRSSLTSSSTTRRAPASQNRPRSARAAGDGTRTSDWASGHRRMRSSDTTLVCSHQSDIWRSTWLEKLGDNWRGGEMEWTCANTGSQTRSAPSLAWSPFAAVSSQAPSSAPRCTAPSSSAANTSTSSRSTPVTRSDTTTCRRTSAPRSVWRRATG